MKRFLKWIGIILGVLLGLAVIAWLGVYFTSQATLNGKFQAPQVNIVVPSDAVALERGEHLATAISVCVECHGDNLGGTVFVDDPMLGRVVAPNLTTGRNGRGSELSDADIARILRYGVKPSGLSVMVMPSDDYSYLSDEDLGAVIAYVRSMPPVDSDLPPVLWRPVGRILLATGQLPVRITDRIDMERQRPARMEPAVSVEYGHYLGDIAGCTGCHGPGLSGGAILGAPPDWPHAANLTPSGELIGWTEEDFFTLIRTGAKPSGKPLDPTMPFEHYAKMTDDELKALWMFIQSLPAREAGTR